MANYRGTDYIQLPNSQKVLIPGSGIAFKTTYGSGPLGNATEMTEIIGSGGSTCPLPMTRVALITLRNASGLTKDCDYVVTDHVQGRLVAGTQIHLQAVSANELSENVQVNTTYDNEAWAGIYDLDRGLVLELHDNRNNVARGLNGNEVSNFDWGNVNISNTTVDNATWTSTIGSPRLVNDVEVLESSVLTTTGQVGGTMNRVTIKGGSSVNTTTANVSLVNWEATRQSSVNLSSFTAASVLNNYTLNNGSINFSNSTSSVSASIVTLVSSVITHSGVTTGTLTGANITMTNSSNIIHSNGAGNLSLNRVDLVNTGLINHSQGTIALSDYEIKDGANIQQTTGVGGNISLSNGVMSGSSQIFNQSASNINGTRFYAEANGIVNINNGAIGTVTLTGTTIKKTSQLIVSATSTAGNTTITNSEIDTTSIIQKTNTGVLNIDASNIENNTRVTVSNTRGLSLVRSSFNDLVQVLQSGTGAVTDTITDSAGDTRGVYNLSSTGAAGHSIQYGIISGLGGKLNVSGTSTGQTIVRARAYASTYNFANNIIANTFSNMSLQEGSTATFQNMTVAKTCTNWQGLNGATINVNNPTGVGNMVDVKAENLATVNITGTAGTITVMNARNSGVITMNGGNCTNIIKEMAGTLTTGNFTHSGVVVINPANATLTANNTNRSSYLGVVSSVPLI